MRVFTPWFDGNARPVRLGIYERKIVGTGLRYSYWNGRTWSAMASTVRGAVDNAGLVSGWQNLTWRGLATKS